MEDFNFFIPAEVIEKSVKLPTGESRTEMIIQGLASDNSKDVEGEVLEPQGYVLDTFLKTGTINYEHLAKRDPKYIIGEPISAEVKGNEFHIKARLWGNSEIAKSVYQKMKELKEAGSSRKAGFSIEGKSLLRDPMNPKRILKALITNVAVTFSPVNSSTFADITKGIQEKDFIPLKYEVADVVDYIFEFERDGKLFRVNKADFKVYEVEKSITTESSAPLIPESLDKKVKVLEPDMIKKSIDIILRFRDLQCLDDDDMMLIRNKIKNFS